jgi:hypothetical protein
MLQRRSGRRAVACAVAATLAAVPCATAAAAPGAVPIPSRVLERSAPSTTLSIANRSATPVRLSAAPLTCMYDHGQHGSDLSALNGQVVGVGQTVSQQVRANASIVDPVVSHLGISRPAQAYRLASPEARDFAFQMLAAYSTVNLRRPRVALPQYASAVARLPSRLQPCATAASTFLIAADQETVSGGGRHTATVWKYGSSGLSSFARAGSLGLAQASAASGSGHETIVISGGAPSHAPTAGDCTDDTAHWMECAFPAGSPAEQRTLTGITWPGTHDSGTSSLHVHGDWMLTSRIRGCSAYTGAFGADPAAVYNLAVSQRLNLRQQLDRGIRYLDVRAAWDSGRGSDPGGTWRIVHSLFSQSTLGIDAATVVGWAAQHPDELVIFDVNHVCPVGADDQVPGVVSALQTPDPISGKSLCDLGYRAQGPAVNASTIADVRKSGRNVVVLLDGYRGDRYGPASALSDCGFNRIGSGRDEVPIHDLWPNVAGPGSCDDGGATTRANQAIAGFPISGSTPNLRTYRTMATVPFMQAQILYTLPGSGPVLAGILRNQLDGACPNTLLQWAQPLVSGAPSRSDIISGWGPDSNIVISDAIDAGYVDQLIGFNTATPAPPS